MSSDFVRARFLFKEVTEKGFDLPLGSVTKDGGVEFRSDLNVAVWNPGEDVSGYKRVRPDDFVIGLRSFQSGIGRSSIEALVSPAYTVLRPISQDVYPPFFRYLFKSSAYISRLENVAQGIRQGRTISTEDFYNIEVRKPSIAEQKAIADYLDRETARIDALIQKKIRYRFLIQSRRQATIDFKTEPIETELPWKQTRIDRVGSVKARVGWKALTASEYVDEGVVFLSTPNIKHSQIDFENVNRITDARYQESPELMLSLGDVLLVKDGSTLGITNIIRDLPEPATVNGSIAVLRIITEESRFIRYFLASSKIQLLIDAIKGGMGVPHLFQQDIKKIPLMCPSVDRQKEIADFLDLELARFDKIVGRLENQIEKLNERREVLIDSAVMGEMEIPEAAA